MDCTTLTRGVYKHFKGGMYEVIFEGRDSTNLEQQVVYRRLSDGSIWIRPKKEFLEKVTLSNGGKAIDVDRFTLMVDYDVPNSVLVGTYDDSFVDELVYPDCSFL